MVFVIKCDDDKQEQGKCQLTVVVSEWNNTNKGIQAFIFLDDSLYGKTNENGMYVIDGVFSGNHTLTCSAIDFRDTTLQINIIGGQNVRFDFYLSSDTTVGKVFGEFEDMVLFKQSTEAKPDIKTWDEKKVYDASTGATMCYKVMKVDLSERRIVLDDSLFTIADGFGQYYFTIQSGTYKITGTCEGYVNSSKIIRVLPDSKNYINFYMVRK
jgi:hypothetical protein